MTDDFASIEPWPATNDTVAPRMLWLANAYAEGAKVLCASMVNEDYAQSYANSRVVVYLCRHAAELFLKGAVLARNGSFKNKHELHELLKEYRKHFPHEKFQVDWPFPSEALETDDGLFSDLLLEDYKKTHDQRFRYPTDKRGIPFEDTEPFDVEKWCAVTERLYASINGMVAHIVFNFPTHAQPHLRGQ